MAFFLESAALSELVDSLLQEVWTQFPDLAEDEIALTIIYYQPPIIVNTGGALSPQEFWKYTVAGYSYRGDEKIYPASVVKLFYLVAVHEWLKQKMVADSPELQRAIADMIIDSSNDATSLIVDVLTGTTSGPELPPAPFATWKKQRNLVNRYFKSWGWQELVDINVNQKPWNEGPYGREKAFQGKSGENRNMLTTNAVARLMHSIVGGVAVSSKRSQEMMQLLKRSLNSEDLAKYAGEEDQVTGFLGSGLPDRAQIWSKAGWTSQTRHDAAYVEIPDGNSLSLVVFTEGKSNAQNKDILPFISQTLLEKLATLTID